LIEMRKFESCRPSRPVRSLRLVFDVLTSLHPDRRGIHQGSHPGGLKNAIDWVSRLPNQPFAGKPVALQSASPGLVGGARMQYDLRKSMMFLDAFTLNKPEIFIGNCASKFDEKTGELKDEATRGFIRQQLASFAAFIPRVAAKS
jgi:chromate reductase, NAD(P)H dehydrogenase (quinone)